MAIVGPYIIQFSSMINAFFVKGIFEDDRWSRFTWIRKFYLFSSLTVIGLAILPILDIYIKVRATVLLLLLPLHWLGCKDFYVKVRKSSESLVNNLLMLTFYEVESFEK